MRLYLFLSAWLSLLSPLALCWPLGFRDKMLLYVYCLNSFSFGIVPDGQLTATVMTVIFQHVVYSHVATSANFIWDWKPYRSQSHGFSLSWLSFMFKILFHMFSCALFNHIFIETQRMCFTGDQQKALTVIWLLNLERKGGRKTGRILAQDSVTLWNSSCLVTWTLLL